MPLYKSRSVSLCQAVLNFRELYGEALPAAWTTFQVRHVAHLLKWASVSIKLGRPVALSKSLLIRELGQKGYLRHLQLIYPVKQGHNLGKSHTRSDSGEMVEHTCSTYDYRAVVEKLLRWVAALGADAVAQFKSGLKAIVRDFEVLGVRMWWFWMEIKNALLKKVTTIPTSIISNTVVPLPLSLACGSLERSMPTASCRTTSARARGRPAESHSRGVFGTSELPEPR